MRRGAERAERDAADEERTRRGDRPRTSTSNGGKMGFRRRCVAVVRGRRRGLVVGWSLGETSEGRMVKKGKKKWGEKERERERGEKIGIEKGSDYGDREEAKGQARSPSSFFPLDPSNRVFFLFAKSVFSAIPSFGVLFFAAASYYASRIAFSTQRVFLR